MAPARALPIRNPLPQQQQQPPRSPCSFDSGTATPATNKEDSNNRGTTSSSTFRRSIRSVRNLFRHCDPDKDYHDNSDHHNDGISVEQEQQQSCNRQNPLAVAVTLTADVRVGSSRRNSASLDMVITTHRCFTNNNNGDDGHSMQFLPIHQYDYYSNNNNTSTSSSKAYVHYEPSQGRVAVGNNPHTKHAKTLWLTVEQYAWMIRQLQHEQITYDIVRDISAKYCDHQHPNLMSMAASATNSTASCSTPCLHEDHQQRRQSNYPEPRVAPLIGIVLNGYSTSSSSGTTQTLNTITRRFSRLMQRAKYHNHHPQHLHYQYSYNPSYHALLLLPKSLLLHAAAYIPVTKPLPPIRIPSSSTTTTTARKKHRQRQQNNHCRHLDASFQPVSDPLSIRLHRYVQLAALCMHDLSLDSTSGSLLCRKCSDPAIIRLRAIPNTSNISVLPINNQPMIQVTTFGAAAGGGNSSSSSSSDATFPITYLHTSLEQRRRTFDSCRHHLSPPSLHIAHNNTPMKYHYHQPRGRACSAIGTDSVIEPFDCSYLLDSTMDKRGYVAIDDENKEIIVTFPGVPASGLLFENTSLAPVPWQEPLDETTNHPPTPTTTTTTTTAQTRSSLLFNTSTTKHHHLDNAYVLECAVAAWRRCELAVATSLMRICRVAPDDYRVVIIGHSLGGAVAALCASSFITTGLLVDRPVTLCTIDSPRVGSAPFVEHLAERVDTIRLTHVSDIWSQMPPRTSGMLHTGSTTVVILEQEEENDDDSESSLLAIKGRSSSSYVLQTNPHKHRDLSWIEDHLDRTFSPYLSPPSLASSTAGAYNNNNGILDHASIWGINLHSAPCQKSSSP